MRVLVSTWMTCTLRYSYRSDILYITCEIYDLKTSFQFPLTFIYTAYASSVPPSRTQTLVNTRNMITLSNYVICFCGWKYIKIYIFTYICSSCPCRGPELVCTDGLLLDYLIDLRNPYPPDRKEHPITNP
jgi:hypothetical protein